MPREVNDLRWVFFASVMGKGYVSTLVLKTDDTKPNQDGAQLLAVLLMQSCARPRSGLDMNRCVYSREILTQPLTS